MQRRAARNAHARARTRTRTADGPAARVCCVRALRLGAVGVRSVTCRRVTKARARAAVRARCTSRQQARCCGARACVVALHETHARRRQRTVRASVAGATRRASECASSSRSSVAGALNTQALHEACHVALLRMRGVCLRGHSACVA
jgi:hypothetical protein